MAANRSKIDPPIRRAIGSQGPKVIVGLPLAGAGEPRKVPAQRKRKRTHQLGKISPSLVRRRHVVGGFNGQSLFAARAKLGAEKDFDIWKI